MERNIGGWIKNYEVYTDEELERVYGIDHPEIKPYLKLYKTVPNAYNLGPYMSRVIEDQGNLGLCFAFAGEGIQEYYNKNTPPLGIEADLSELFLGYWARYILEGGPPYGDEGCTILATMQAMVKYGICLATLWPYVESKSNTKPPKVAMDDAYKYRVTKYFSIPEDSTKLTKIKQSVYGGAPIMFGSEVSNDIFYVGKDGLEPYSTPDDSIGGHARFIYGWDDTKIIPQTSRKGAFLVRNSWGPDWGMNGDSWVSYQVFDDQDTDCMGITAAVYPNSPQPTPTDPCKKFKDFIKKFFDEFSKL